MPVRVDERLHCIEVPKADGVAGREGEAGVGVRWGLGLGMGRIVQKTTPWFDMEARARGEWG